MNPVTCDYTNYTKNIKQAKKAGVSLLKISHLKKIFVENINNRTKFEILLLTL